MSYTYKLKRKCKKCGIKISDNNKSGYCKKCYLKFGTLGENNPFYGRKHTEETLSLLKEKCRKASKEKWKDETYRKHVLDSVIGLKRSEKFKKEQSERTKQQMKDPEQRKIRSKSMKKSWDLGLLTSSAVISSSISKQQIEFFKKLKQYIYVKEKHVIKYKNENTGRNRHLFPDGYIEEYNLVIEYNGSFWHADKRQFNENDVVHHGITAKEIWEKDNKRKELFNKLGYKYIEVWSNAYLNSDKDTFIKDFYEQLKNQFK